MFRSNHPQPRAEKRKRARTARPVLERSRWGWASPVALAVALSGSLAAAVVAQPPSWLASGIGQGHAWPMRAADPSHSGLAAAAGPDDASILPPWPFVAAGAIASSAVVDRHQRIYVGSDDGTVIALRAGAISTSALVRWRFAADGPVTGAPALARDLDGQTLIYAADEAGRLHALAADGSVRWQLDVGGPVVASLATFDRGADVWIYLKAGTDLVAVRDDLAASTGNVTWRRTLGGAGSGPDTAPALSPGGAWVAATDAARELSVLDASSGAAICTGVALGGDPTTPVVDADGVVYVGLDDAGQGGVEAWEVAGLGCQQRFATAAGPVRVAPTVLPGGVLLAQDGAELIGLERVSGNLLWSEPAPWSGAASAVTGGGRRLYVPGADGAVHAYRVEPSGLVAAWRLATDQLGQMATPAIDALGRLIVPSRDRHVYVLQDLPAFMVAFGSEVASADLEIHTLREIYGELDPIADPWARIVRRTDSPADDTQPTHAVDATLLAWSVTDGGPANVVMAAAGGGEAVVVTDDDGSGAFSATSRETDPAFSPVHPTRGSRLPDRGFVLAMTADDGDGKDLRFLDLTRLHGGRVVEGYEAWLGRQAVIPPGAAVAGYVRPGEQRSQPAFAPDGRAFAYSACERSGAISTLTLVIQALTPGTLPTRHFPTQVAPDCPEALERGFGPAFSPDGAHVAYHLYGGGLRIHAAGSATSIVLPDPAGARPSFPSWSPDGTEIVAVGDLGGFGAWPRAIYAFQGQRYQDVRDLTAPLAATASGFDAAEHHPSRFPEPLLDVDCTAPGVAPPLILPAAARPGETVAIYGCGFDIKVWERQTVAFTHATETDRFVDGRVLGASVDVVTGLGVLEVEVPRLAGNGPVAIGTAFGRTETRADPADCRDADPINDDGCFLVRPEAVALRQPETVIGAKIRVVGYGMQVVPNAASPDPRLDRVYFTGATGQQTVAATVHAARFAPCGPSTATPCPPGAPIDADDLPKVAWLEVTVPVGARPGPVSVVGPGATVGHACCSLGFLTPSVSVTPDNGSQGFATGPPGTPGAPTSFAMSGEGFPFDPYFGYDGVTLAQQSVDPASGAVPSNGTVELGFAPLVPTVPGGHVAGFTSLEHFVRPDPLTNGGDLRMRATGLGSTATAFARFRTPLRGLPIIFVPGTTGTFLSNVSGAPIQGGSGTYPVGADIWMSEATAIEIARPTVAGLPLTLNANQDYLYDAVALNRADDGPRTPGIGPSRTIVAIPLPTLSTLVPGAPPAVPIYTTFVAFLGGPGGLGRPAGNPLTGACPGANNCFYLFPMDWRMGYASQAAALGTLVRSVKAATGQPKVLLIGHSMGGAVIDFYLRTDSFAEDDVDQVVTLGSSPLGVALPYRVLQKGHNWGLGLSCCFGLDLLGIEVLGPETGQRMAIDWPTAYWQLPSRHWFDNPNGACPPGGCWTVWEDDWDVDGDGFCGSRNDGSGVPCSGHVSGKHRDGARTLAFMRNAEHDGCHDCDGDPSQGGDQVNVMKLDRASARLLGGPPDLERVCTLADGTPHRAPMGDWRCGTGEIFYHRVVGWGAETDGRFRFYKTSRCAHWGVVGALGGGILGGFLSPVAALGCLAREERRDVLPVDGDGIVPLRGAIGILDGFDDRLWGIDGSVAGLGGAFHGGLPNLLQVRTLMRRIAGGLITNLSQVPVAASAGGPYFRVPRGNPLPATGTPAFAALCGAGACPAPPFMPPPSSSSRTEAAPRAKTESEDRASADRLRVTVTGDAAVHVFDAQGRHRGTVTAATLGLEPIPGVAVDADRTETRAVLPLGDETGYRVVVAHSGAADAGGAPVEVPIHLRIEGVREQDVLWSDRFDGLPLLVPTAIEVPIGDGRSVPELTIDALGDGDLVAIEALTLSGEALDDDLRPETVLAVAGGTITVEATDRGSSGIDRVLYGFDRGQTAPRVYEGPVDLPAEVRHVWAYATDRAGNVEAAKTWNDAACDDGLACVAQVVVGAELVDGVLEPGAEVVVRAELENLGETAVVAASLRLTLGKRELRIAEVLAEPETCGHFLGNVICDLTRLEPGTRFAVEVRAEVLRPEPVPFRLEALLAETLADEAVAAISGQLGGEP